MSMSAILPSGKTMSRARAMPSLPRRLRRRSRDPASNSRMCALVVAGRRRRPEQHTRLLGDVVMIPSNPRRGMPFAAANAHPRHMRCPRSGGTRGARAPATPDGRSRSSPAHPARSPPPRPRPRSSPAGKCRTGGLRRRPPVQRIAVSELPQKPMPPMSSPPPAAWPEPSRRLVGDDGLGGEEERGDGGRVLQRRAGDLGRVDDAGGDHVDVVTGRGVEALARGQVAHLSATTPPSRPALTAICLSGASEATRTMLAPSPRRPGRQLVEGGLGRLEGATPPPATMPSSTAALALPSGVLDAVLASP